jgi:hypothetical protein
LVLVDRSLIGLGIHEHEMPSLLAHTDCALKDTLGGCLVLGEIIDLKNFTLLVELLQTVSLLLLLRRYLIEGRGRDLTETFSYFLLRFFMIAIWSRSTTYLDATRVQ